MSPFQPSFAETASSADEGCCIARRADQGRLMMSSITFADADGFEGVGHGDLGGEPGKLAIIREPGQKTRFKVQRGKLFIVRLLFSTEVNQRIARFFQTKRKKSRAYQKI